MRTGLILLLLSGLPAWAGFPQPTQSVRLAYGQKSVTLTFQADCDIKRAKPLCDCTTVSFHGRQLTANVDTSKFDQSVDKQIEVTTTDGKTTKLTMKFDVPPAIVLSARSFAWKKGGPATPQTLRITIPKGSPVSEVLEAGVTSEAFDFQTHRIKSGSEYTVAITPVSTDKAAYGELVIKTKSSDPRFSLQIIYLQIKK